MFQTDIIFAIPLGLLFYMFVEKLAEVVINYLDHDDKANKIILLLFVSGIVGIVLAKTLFMYNKTLKNKIISNSLMIGGFILVLYPTLTNWSKLSNEIKLLVIGLILFSLMIYSYEYV